MNFYEIQMKNHGIKYVEKRSITDNPYDVTAESYLWGQWVLAYLRIFGGR